MRRLFRAVAKDLVTGREPRPDSVSAAEVLVKDLCNLFLIWRFDRLEVRDISTQMCDDQRRAIEHFVKKVGTARTVVDSMVPLWP